MTIAREYHESLEGGLVGAQFEEAFYRTMVSNRVRDGEQMVARRPNEEDLASISEFVRTGRGLINDLDCWDKYVCNQRFFSHQERNNGLGTSEQSTRGPSMGVQWKMPFTVRSREEDTRDDFDFVGCCYLPLDAHGQMDGEVYESGQYSMCATTYNPSPLMPSWYM